MTVMSYFLAIDVGTSRTAASTARSAPDGSIVTAAFSLGRSSDSAPSAIFAADGELLFGEAAERRGLAQPERLIREFKRRVGDDVPIIAGDQRFAPEELYARMVAWVVEAVAEREGGRPAGISVAVPVTWGGHRSGLVSAALSREISGEVRLISEPEAAARHYEATSPLEPGHALAVYDLGGGTFDAVILRKDDEGRVRIVGEPLGIADFGGADFDDIVLRHAIAAAGLSAAGLAADPAARVGLSTLRRECVEAKEALSFDSEAVVPLLVGQVNSTVRLTRSEFEEMIEGGVERTIDVLATALETAGVDSTELDAILLTGGSSRIPRIAELLSERFDRPIAIDADPKAIVALGAARAMADPRAGVSTALAVAVPAGARELAPAEDVTADTELLGDTGAAAAAARRRWFERVPATAAIASGALVLATGIVLASATGLGSNPVSNADATSKSLSEWLGVTLFDAPSASADQPATAAAEAPAPPGPARVDPARGLLTSVGDDQEHAEGVEPPLREHAERDAGLCGAPGSGQRFRRIERRHDARRLDEPDRRHRRTRRRRRPHRRHRRRPRRTPAPAETTPPTRTRGDHAAARTGRDHTASRTGRDHTASRTAKRPHRLPRRKRPRPRHPRRPLLLPEPDPTPSPTDPV